jgi:hypothetical protein
MGASVQLNLPPTEVQRVASPPATPGNFVASLDLASAVLRAAGRLGMADKELAAIFDISAPECSKAFGPNNPDRNRLMKTALPPSLVRELAAVLGESCGLTVAGADSERHALADMVEAASRFIRVVAR